MNLHGEQFGGVADRGTEAAEDQEIRARMNCRSKACDAGGAA
jgi:hypothetical protein